MGAVGRVSAEPTNTSDSFPLNELMQPDYRYLNSAIYPNTGVYDGDVTVNAMYDWDLFSPTAGNYLPANSTTITQCTAGNFCAGATDVHYDSIDQGITACSTLGDNSYTQSVAGSSLETDCYRNCSGNVTIEHATTITGNDYYGNGTDTCTATACEGGYHTDNNACGANTLTITWANSDNPNTTCTYGGSITTPATAPTIPGKTFVGWAMGYDFSTLPTGGGGISRYAKGVDISTNEDHCMQGAGSGNSVQINCNDSNESDLVRQEWKVRLSWGTIYGKALCSLTSGSGIGVPNESEGANCWCKVVGYIPNNLSVKYVSVNPLPWVGTDSPSPFSIDTCPKFCSMRCAFRFDTSSIFRRAMFGVSN